MTSPSRSISVFFPAFNDGGTIASMVVLAARTVRNVTDDFEVFFDTLDTTRKVRNLRRNPKIAFVIGGLTGFAVASAIFLILTSCRSFR